MVNTIIIDDEQHCIDAVLYLIKTVSNNINVIGTFTNVEEAILETPKLNPDLVFLDVEIGNKTGFDYLTGINHINFQVVFTTAHDKYAIAAIKFSALDYLLKPIDEDEFKTVLLKFEQSNKSSNLAQKMDALLYNLNANSSEKRITINTKNDFHVLSISDILYCKASINYTEIYAEQHTKIISSKTLKYYNDLLIDCDFYRVDQSYLVNMRFVKRYTKGKPAYVILNNGFKIKVSLSNKEGFLAKLNSMY